MRIDEELKHRLAEELCAIMDGWTQIQAASLLHISQSHVSRLRRGKLAEFSAGRLLRLIASQGYNVDVALRVIPNRFAKPRPLPTLSVLRYDRFGRPSQ